MLNGTTPEIQHRKWGPMQCTVKKLGDFSKFCGLLTICIWSLGELFFCSDLIPNHLLLLFSFAVLQGCLLDAIHRCKKRPSMSHFLSKISLATSSGRIDLQGIPYYRRPSDPCSVKCKNIISKKDMLRIRFELLKSSKYSSKSIIESEWCFLLSSFLKIVT